MGLHKAGVSILLAASVWGNTFLTADALNLNDYNSMTGDRTYSIGSVTETLTNNLGNTSSGIFSVNGENQNTSIFSGGGQYNFFRLTSTDNTVLNLNNLTIQDALKSNGGGSVLVLQNGNTANIESVIMKDNTATPSGGAIYSNNGNLNIKDSIFDNNKSNASGGAIVVYGTDGKTVIDNSTFQNNSASITGAVYISESDLTLTNSIFRNNQSTSSTSTSNPGALRIGSGNAASLVDNCLFDSNVSGYNAGAVYSFGNTTIKNSGFTNNYANFRGGALIVGSNSNTSVTGSYFSNNSSQEFAGAIYNDGNLIIDNTVIEGNKALHHEPSGTDGRGGAIYNSGQGILIINENTLVKGNSAAGDGGGIANSSGIISVNGAVFDSNVSNGNGGAIWTTGAAEITGGTAFIGNTATGQGGAIYNQGRTDLTSGTNGDIIFQNNASGSGANDIYTRNELNINGDSGSVLLSDGVSGYGVINKSNGGNLILHGDSSNYTGTFNQNGGTTAISDGKWFAGTSNIQGGTLEWGTGAQKTGGVINMTSGALYVHPDATLDLNNSADTISADAVIYLDKDAVINNQGTITFNEDDSWHGKVNNTNNVTLDNATVYDGTISHTDGEFYMYNNSIFTVNPDSTIRGGNMTINSGSILNIPDNYFLVNNLNMDNGTINTLNGKTDTNFISNNFAVGTGGAHFNIDFDGDRKVADQFAANNYIGSGTISVDRYNVSGAPTDIRIPFPVFTGTNVENMTFAATNDIVNTPLYKYNLRSEGAGIYSLIRGEENPSINRGAESIEAMFLNNINVINMIFEHVYIDSEQFTYARTHSGKPEAIYMPYQDIRHEKGSVWFKPYVTYDRFSLHNNNMVYNTSYGSILGFDFPTKQLENGGKFLPTAFITYQGARQASNGNNYYQNGGMGGLMGTYFKGDWISSILAYGGGFSNEMQGFGYNDRVGNWYAGAAGITAYNFHPKKNVIIQPMLWTAYNVIGKQNWTSSFGNVPYSTGYLNGLAVSPALNTFYGNEKWSVYGTISYVFTINDHVKSYAGPLAVDSARLRYGFLQYGVGFIRTWKDRCLAYGQVTLRQGGFTGIAFWGGLAYRL